VAQFLIFALQSLEAFAFRHGNALTLAAIDFFSFDPSSSVWLVQPILGAMDSIAAQCEGSSSRCSCAMHTARSRTSAENLFDLCMAPFSQELQSPQNLERFRVGCFILHIAEFNFEVVTISTGENVAFQI